MPKIKKTYSLDEKIIEKLQTLAEAEGINQSAMLAIIINEAARTREPLSVKGAKA